MDEKWTTFACVVGTLVLGSGILLLQLRTLHDVCVKDDEWPTIVAVCQATSRHLSNLCKNQDCLTHFIASSNRVQYNGIVTLVFDEKLSLRSEGLSADSRVSEARMRSSNEERMSSILQVLSTCQKTEASVRKNVSFSRMDGRVKQHELCVRWVDCASCWVVALKWS